MTTGPLPEIVLASSSPRRQALLAQIGLPFRVVEPNVDETPRPHEEAAAFALRAAADKATEVTARLRGDSPAIVIGADTVVSLGRELLGKPRDSHDACRMLRLLSGRTHQVTTGVCLRGKAVAPAPVRVHAFFVQTDVEIAKLTEEEIAAYIATGEPMDKAGAYAIQGRAAHMVRSIRGSYTNVVGLPLAELVAALAGAFHYPPHRVKEQA